MQGVQKTKCTKCGTSDTGNTMCPSCLEPAQGRDGADSNSGMTSGGCGCGHSH